MICGILIIYNILRIFVNRFKFLCFFIDDRECYMFVDIIFGKMIFYNKVYMVWMYVVLIYIILLIFLVILNCLIIMKLMCMCVRRIGINI